MWCEFHTTSSKLLWESPRQKGTNFHYKSAEPGSDPSFHQTNQVSSQSDHHWDNKRSADRQIDTGEGTTIHPSAIFIKQITSTSSKWEWSHWDLPVPLAVFAKKRGYKAEQLWGGWTSRQHTCRIVLCIYFILLSTSCLWVPFRKT